MEAIHKLKRIRAGVNQPAHGDVQASEEVPMSPDIIDYARVEALFVSAVQPSETMTAEEIRTAVSQAICSHGTAGCAAMVAYEFGEHPEIAVARMQWANAVVAQAFVTSIPDAA
jgi:hypothetical protein